MKAQLTALAMEKQALLEDIALGNSARGERLAAIEQDRSVLFWRWIPLKLSMVRSCS